MTAARLHSVDHADLVLGRRLGQGGQGTVHEVTNRTISVGGGPGWPVVFKEYDAALQSRLDADALAAMVTMVFELNAMEGAWLCERAAWPAAVVERQGRACGFLMRAVPDRFRFDLRSLSGATTTGPRLANVEYLLNDDAYIAGIGLTISDSDRVALLAELAATLARLHRLDIVVGDLSPKNLLFSTVPGAACFLLDCDAMRLRGASVLPQAETPDWQLPPGEEKATRPGDIYKFGLLAVRLFDRSQTTADPSALAAVTPALGDLARTSLAPEPALRPSLGMWTEMLCAATPTAAMAAPSRSASRPSRIAVTPTPPPVPGPPDSQTAMALGLGIAVVVIIALVVALVAMWPHPARNSGAPVAATSAAQHGYSAATTTSTPTAVTRVGIVDIAPALTGDPRAVAVATLFNTYFSGIDNHAYDVALGTLDPSGSFDPGNPQNRASFADALSTTFDRDVEVISIDPAGSLSTATSARVTFQSTQAAGMGPRGQEWETCTNWDLSYTLSWSGAGYLIYHSTPITQPRAC
ncbi:hypothetical protein ACWEP5_05505 [Nocardia niigatensis]